MATLKILWKEKQDMRRVQLISVNQTLMEKDTGRIIENVNTLRFVDLKDYIFYVFPEIQQLNLQVFLYYTDDEEELVRITNDEELAEGLRLMEEITIAEGKNPKNAVCRVTVITKQVTTTTTTINTTTTAATTAASEEEQSFLGNRQKKMNSLFVDISKLLEKWEEGQELQVVKRDILSLLHEPGCQEALLDILSNHSFAPMCEKLSTEFHKTQNLSSCLMTCAQEGYFDEVAPIFIRKCPQAKLQIERIMLHLKHKQQIPSAVQCLSASDYFENITLEESHDQGEKEPPQAHFEKDMSLPDGSIVLPGKPFDKIWRLRNIGRSKWPEGVKLTCVGGDKMGAPDFVLIPSVVPNSFIDVALRMTGPQKAGRFTGYWRLCTAEGRRFGQRLWVDVSVMNTNTSSPPHGNISGGGVRVGAPTPFVRHNSAGKSVNVPAPASVTVTGNGQEDTPRWENELRALRDMGFTDKDKNIRLLVQHDGDLAAVVSGLL